MADAIQPTADRQAHAVAANQQAWAETCGPAAMSQLP